MNMSQSAVLVANPSCGRRGALSSSCGSARPRPCSLCHRNQPLRWRLRSKPAGTRPPSGRHGRPPHHFSGRQSAPFNMDNCSFVCPAEIEVAFAVSHVTIDNEARCVSLRLLLPQRKTSRAVGCICTLRCSCRNDEQVASTCPYHVVVVQLALLCVRFGHSLSDDLPLFPLSMGRALDKAVVVQQLINTVRAFGGTTKDACFASLNPNDLQLWVSKWQK